MSEEALAEREHARLGHTNGFANGDATLDMNGNGKHANGSAHSMKVGVHLCLISLPGQVQQR